MDIPMLQFLAGIAMAVVAVGLVYGIRRYMVANSERRMRAMMDAVGLDPDIVTSNDVSGIIQDVRKRCRSCASEGVCERWLQGEEERGNDFCPNARVFEVLRKYGDKAA